MQPGSPTSGVRSGFSLVELMIAITMGLIIMGVLTFSVTTSGSASSRAIASNQVHMRARNLIDVLRRDLEAMVPTAAFRIGDFGADAGGTNDYTPELVFLAAADRLDRDYDAVPDEDGVDYDHDLVWVRYLIEEEDAVPDDGDSGREGYFKVIRQWIPAVHGGTTPPPEYAETGADLPPGTDFDPDSSTYDVTEAVFARNVRRFVFRAYHADLTDTGAKREWNQDASGSAGTGTPPYDEDFDGVSVRGPRNPPSRPAYIGVTFILESDSEDLQKEFVRTVRLP